MRLPKLSGYSTLVIVAEDARGTSAAAYAIDGDHPKKPLVLHRSASNPGTLSVYLYTATLDALGLQEGDVEVAPEGALGHPLANAEVLYHAQDPGEGALDWIEDTHSARTLWITGALPPTAPCPRLTVHELMLPRSTWVTASVPLGTDAAMIATREGAFFRVTSSTVTRLAQLTRDVPHGAGFEDDSGVVWLTGCEDQLARVYPDDSFSVQMGAPCDMGNWLDGPAMIGLDGARGGAPTELYGITRSGHFRRLTEDRSDLILDLAHTIYFHYVSWVGPGEAIMVTRTPDVVWFRDNKVDMVTPVWSGAGDPPEVTRAMLFPDRGVVLAAYTDADGSRFTMLERESGMWRVFAASDLGGRTYDLRPRGDGFTFAGAAGQAGVYSPSTGFCATTISGFVFYYGVPVGDRGLFLVGFHEAGNEDTDRVWWISID